MAIKSFHFCVLAPLQCNFASLPVKVAPIYLPLDPKLANVTCFGQWDIGRCDAKGLENTGAMGLAFLCCY